MREGSKSDESANVPLFFCLVLDEEGIRNKEGGDGQEDSRGGTKEPLDWEKKGELNAGNGACGRGGKSLSV